MHDFHESPITVAMQTCSAAQPLSAEGGFDLHYLVPWLFSLTSMVYDGEGRAQSQLYMKFAMWNPFADC